MEKQKRPPIVGEYVLYQMPEGEPGDRIVGALISVVHTDICINLVYIEGEEPRTKYSVMRWCEENAEKENWSYPDENTTTDDDRALLSLCNWAFWEKRKDRLIAVIAEVAAEVFKQEHDIMQRLMERKSDDDN